MPVVCVTGTFPIIHRGIDTGQKEFVVSHGIDMDTGRNVILPSEHPAKLGARYDKDLMEWVIADPVDDQAERAPRPRG